MLTKTNSNIFGGVKSNECVLEISMYLILIYTSILPVPRAMHGTVKRHISNQNNYNTRYNMLHMKNATYIKLT